jgi:hypothetical protein
MDGDGGRLPAAVLLGGAAGMALGLWWDDRAGGVAMLASLCRGGPRDFAGMLALHWDLLPGMHLGTLAGVVAPCWMTRRRPSWGTIGTSISCLAWMVLGMAAGTLAFASQAGWTASPVATLSAMLVGMCWGMAASAAMGWLAAMPALGRSS